MQDLRLLGVHEDGEHLLLAGSDGDHYTLPLDESLRTAVRRDRPHQPRLNIDVGEGMRPREVQSMIRGGATAEEVADRAGWTVEKVRNYEVPILAERSHVADQARQVRVRSRGGSASAAAPTLLSRVGQRLRERGVDAQVSGWDSWREPDAKNWTVVLFFAAGGRQRQATWVYDPVLRTVEALDDEARWLSADEPAPAGPLPSTPARVSSVYDVEAEGGVGATIRRTPPRPDEPVDLMTAMRERTTVGRRSGRRRSAATDPSRREAQPLPLDQAGQENPEFEAVAEGLDLPGDDNGAKVVAGEMAALEPAGAETPPLEDHDAAGGDASVEDVNRLAEAGPDAATMDGAEFTADGSASGSGEAPEQPDVGAADHDTQPTPIRASKRKPRTSVPSWDDIMFGTKRD